MSKNPQSALKATIDKMVRESIQRILPEVMNEVLLRTLANANVVQEQRQAPPRQQTSRPQQPSKAAQRAQQLAGVDRARSLREVLNAEESGVDYYARAEQMMAGRQAPPVPRQNFAPQPIQEDYEFDFDDEEEQPAPPPSPMAQRISQLPPQLQALAEDTFRHAAEDDDANEMWGDDEWAPTPDGEGSPGLSQPKAPSLNIEHASRAAGVDWGVARKLLGNVEKKVDVQDKLAEAQWKQEQLNRYRESLNRKA